MDVDQQGRGLSYLENSYRCVSDIDDSMIRWDSVRSRSKAEVGQI
jgi:hypothetical protein